MKGKGKFAQECLHCFENIKVNHLLLQVAEANSIDS